MALNHFVLELNKILEEIKENEKIEENKELIESKKLINNMKINSSKMIEIKSIESIERFNHFCIDCDGNYDSFKSIPKLLLPEKRKQLNIDLEIGFEESFINKNLITNYNDYKNKKWNYFLKCLKENELISKFEPKFVSFGGPVSDIMATVYDSGIQWKVLAQMFEGVIYLFKSRTQTPINDSFYGEVNKHSFCGLKFLYLMTDRNQNQLNEFEKHFVINGLKLDSHKLLTLNEIDAIDENGKAVDVKVVEMIRTSKSQEFFNRKKLLRFWSKAWVQGIDKLILGNRDSENYLIDIEEREVTKIPENCTAYWSDSKCIEFLDRMFDLMKKCITEEDIVYELSFNRGEEFVSCNRLNPINSNHILPESYTKSEK